LKPNKRRYENQLRGKAEQLIQALAGVQVTAAVREDSFEEYAVKLAVRYANQAGGSINLYYSPKRDEYTCRVHQVTQAAAATVIETCWQTIATTAATPQAAPPIPAIGYQVYVDGSYVNGKVGYGAVLLNDGQEMQRFSGRVREDTDTRQVAGELVATMTVLDYCVAQQIPTLEILYDYEGIEKWARGLWKANIALTQRYAAYMRACPIKIKWHKVRSHSGNAWNDVADQLAKQGAQTH
jgi:ribonuclease HI